VAKDLDDEYQVGRLATAMRASRLALQRFRDERREAVREYVGGHWSADGNAKKVPVNLLSIYTQIVGRSLISKNPKVMLSTFNRSAKPAVSAMEAWANRQIEKMDLAGTMQRVVLDALFSIGVVKVALASPSDSALKGWQLNSGEPFCERVDLDDFVYDIGAKDFREVTFIGHRFRVPLETIRDSKIYNKARKDLTPSDNQIYNEVGDERIGALTRGMLGSNVEDYEEMVDLWEIYLPRKKKVLTLTEYYQSGNFTVLREQEWVGPDSGPYHFMSFMPVPGNAMPKAPIQDLIDLHIAANENFRKMMRQAQRHKDITVVTGQNQDDANTIKNANDGDVVMVKSRDAAVPLQGPGVNATVNAAAMQFKEIFSWVSGNLDSMGGLSPQSKTLGQDKMLAETSSKQINDLQETTIKATSRVLSALCWYWWKDPFKIMKSTYSLPNMPDISAVRKVTPDQRVEIPFEELDIHVDPYSMLHQTPQQRVGQINQIVQQTIMPMMQMLQSQGIMFDANAYLSKVAKYLDMPDLMEILQYQEPPENDAATGSQVGGGQEEMGAKPAQTERTYNRVSMPGRTNSGDAKNLISSLLGVNTGGNPNETKA
jgi:hypothetical protein